MLINKNSIYHDFPSLQLFDPISLLPHALRSRNYAETPFGSLIPASKGKIAWDKAPISSRRFNAPFTRRWSRELIDCAGERSLIARGENDRVSKSNARSGSRGLPVDSSVVARMMITPLRVNNVTVRHTVHRRQGQRICVVIPEYSILDKMRWDCKQGDRASACTQWVRCTYTLRVSRRPNIRQFLCVTTISNGT